MRWTARSWECLYSFEASSICIFESELRVWNSDSEVEVNQIATVARASCGFDDAGTADLERLWSRDEIARPVHREWQRDQSNVRCKSLETSICAFYIFLWSRSHSFGQAKSETLISSKAMPAGVIGIHRSGQFQLLAQSPSNSQYKKCPAC